MNTDTGKVYSGGDIVKAIARGERLRSISEAAARRIGAGRKLLAQKLRGSRRKKKARRRDALTKASRRANR